MYRPKSQGIPTKLMYKKMYAQSSDAPNNCSRRNHVVYDMIVSCQYHPFQTLPSTLFYIHQHPMSQDSVHLAVQKDYYTKTLSVFEVALNGIIRDHSSNHEHCINMNSYIWYGKKMTPDVV